MMHFIAGNTAVENASALAQSALPNAPQQPYDEPAPRRTFAVRARLSAVLRTAAERELRLANRIDPTCTVN
ncbi:hypothetical protein [Kribbella speibonae]|uniref:Uncharacterized protein n=1 Tax=Kribbella speibonae TaxID=1572660 RepID=A0A4R0J6G7_9ACTN|nr:hypothetical protein [Kribbella speibonae]TCC20370.1 hypothetical protein E0H58_30100 [Kribbella speibonae]TCC41639.1 hypothetical protein E0H92_08295 [Kribbella speibonae]